jgi:hypothetical protein
MENSTRILSHIGQKLNYKMPTTKCREQEGNGNLKFHRGINAQKHTKIIKPPNVNLGNYIDMHKKIGKAQYLKKLKKLPKLI